MFISAQFVFVFMEKMLKLQITTAHWLVAILLISSVTNDHYFANKKELFFDRFKMTIVAIFNNFFKHGVS